MEEGEEEGSQVFLPFQAELVVEEEAYRRPRCFPYREEERDVGVDGEDCEENEEGEGEGEAHGCGNGGVTGHGHELNKNKEAGGGNRECL